MFLLRVQAAAAAGSVTQKPVQKQQRISFFLRKQSHDTSPWLVYWHYSINCNKKREENMNYLWKNSKRVIVYEKRFLPGVLWMGDFDIILTFKKNRIWCRQLRNVVNFSHATQKPQRALILWGFLVRYGEPLRLGCCCLLISVQPFAYVVADHSCSDRNKKRDDKISHSTHLLSAGGSTASKAYHISC